MTARLARLAAFTFVVLMFAAPAHADWCRFTAMPSMTFGNYDVFSPTPVYVTGTLTWQCNGTKDHSVRISLGTGLNSITFSPRIMRGGIGSADSLPYNLYLDATCTTIWGDDTGGTQSYMASGLTGSPRIYGRIPAGQDVSAGSYSDTITVTIDY